MCVAMHVESKVDIGKYPLLLLYLILQGIVSQTNPELTDLASFTSQLAVGLTSLPCRAVITGRLPLLPDFWAQELRASYLYSKCFNH